MSAPHNFRSAFNGFNREDVVSYLEYLNSRHNSQITQLTSELDFFRNRQETVQDNTDILDEREELRARVAELESRCIQLEQLLAQAEEQIRTAVPEQVPVQPQPQVFCEEPQEQVAVAVAVEPPVAEPAHKISEELEAYRRAERAERLAKERAELVYHQVNGVLAEASSKVDGAAADIGTMADQAMQQLMQLQAAVRAGKDIFCDAASTVSIIKPNN